MIVGMAIMETIGVLAFVIAIMLVSKLLNRLRAGRRRIRHGNVSTAVNDQLEPVVHSRNNHRFIHHPEGILL